MKPQLLIYSITPLIALSSLSDSTSTDQDEFDRYIWLNTEGMQNSSVPNAEIHEMITVGLSHENPDIVDCTLGALGLYIGASRAARRDGREYPLDRELRHKKEWYGILVEMWEDNWKKAGNVLPQPLKRPPAGYLERIKQKKQCMVIPNMWTSLPLTLAYLYPQDSKVYEIIWEAYPIPRGGFRGHTIRDDNNPLPLLSALFDGQFNHDKDQQFRIDLLLNREMSHSMLEFAATSLGLYHSEDGLNAMADRLAADNYEYGTPKLQLIESILEYEEKSKQYIPLLRMSLESARATSRSDEVKKAVLQERLVHFEEKYGEKRTEQDQIDQPLR